MPSSSFHNFDQFSNNQSRYTLSDIVQLTYYNLNRSAYILCLSAWRVDRSCNYDGSGRRTVLYSPDALRHPFSITTFEDYVYWTDWDKETIFKANKFTGKEVEPVTSVRTLKHPMVVHVYHPYRQPDGMNQCQAVNGHCSHLCLPAPRINSKSPLLSCACPDGLRLLPDGLMCVEKGKLNQALISKSDNVHTDLICTSQKSREWH